MWRSWGRFCGSLLWVGVVALAVASMSAFGVGPTGDSIATMKANNPVGDSLWKFLLKLPETAEAQLLYGLWISGFLGIAAHYVHLWLTESIEGSLWNYLFHQYPRRTLLTVCAYVAWTFTLVGTSVFETDAGIFVGWWNVLLFGASNGFGVDALANKGSLTTVAAKPG